MDTLVLTATQNCKVSVLAIKDKKGNPAQYENPVWSSSDSSIITVGPDPNAPTDPLMAMISAVGPMTDAASVSFDADADLGEGVKPLIGVIPVIVKAGEATVVELAVGTPTEQP